MQNPYGAVPEALRDTRLSLRDIMSDILVTKKMEGDLSLAKSKAETDTALVQAGIDRDRLSNTKDIARLDQIDRQHADTFGLAKAAQEFDQGPKFQSQKDLNDAHVKLLNSQNAKEQHDLKAKNELLTGKEYATRIGAGYMADLLGVGDEKLPAHQWEGLGKNIMQMHQKSPGMQFIAAGYKLQSELQDLRQQYHTPGLPTETKATLKKTLESKAKKLGFINDLMNDDKLDPVKVATETRKSWAEIPALQNQYKDYDDYHTKTFNGLKESHGAYHDEAKQWKLYLATADISPNFMEDLQSANTIIGQFAEPKLKDQITTGTKQRLDKGDLKGAYQYTTDWAKYLESRKGAVPVISPKKETPSPAKAPSLAESVPHPGVERLKNTAGTLAGAAKTAWSATGGKLGDAMDKRKSEHTNAARQELAALNRTPTATEMEDIQRKYPYAAF